MPIVAGGVLMALFALERLVLRAAGIVVDHDPNAEDVHPERRVSPWT